MALSTIIHRMKFQEKLMIQTEENGQNPQKPQKMRFLRFAEPQHFFLKIGLRHFSPFTSEQLCAKYLRNPMVGSMRILRHRQTD